MSHQEPSLTPVEGNPQNPRDRSFPRQPENSPAYRGPGLALETVNVTEQSGENYRNSSSTNTKTEIKDSKDTLTADQTPQAPPSKGWSQEQKELHRPEH